MTKWFIVVLGVDCMNVEENTIRMRIWFRMFPSYKMYHHNTKRMKRLFLSIDRFFLSFNTDCRLYSTSLKVLLHIYENIMNCESPMNAIHRTLTSETPLVTYLLFLCVYDMKTIIVDENDDGYSYKTHNWNTGEEKQHFKQRKIRYCIWECYLHYFTLTICCGSSA